MVLELSVDFKPMCDPRIELNRNDFEDGARFETGSDLKAGP